MTVETRLSLENGNLVVHSYQDAEDVIEHNKKLQGMEQKSDWGRHVASVPNNVLIDWFNQYAQGDPRARWMDGGHREFIWKKLNDHDWLFLRTD